MKVFSYPVQKQQVLVDDLLYPGLSMTAGWTSCLFGILLSFCIIFRCSRNWDIDRYPTIWRDQRFVRMDEVTCRRCCRALYGKVPYV